MERPKGTKDIFGNVINQKEDLVSFLKSVVKKYCFSQIETPIFEKAEVFRRTIGDETEIVEKQLYEFRDKKNRLLVLRPEGTAGVMRAVVENKMFTRIPLKLFYCGPMFRYERPQKNRWRQFEQFGLELLCEENIYYDLEVLEIAKEILDYYKLKYFLEINYLASKETRSQFAKQLTKYFLMHKNSLSQYSQRRIKTNPLRILDVKEDRNKECVKNAPKITNFYSEDETKYFKNLVNLLKAQKIPFKINSNLIRGLDYYSGLAFEFISSAKNAGSNATIIGGGRYNLLKDFGGPEISGIGFAIGIERFLNNLSPQHLTSSDEKVKIFIINYNLENVEKSYKIALLLREKGFRTYWEPINYKNIKKAFNRADRLGFNIKIICTKQNLDNNSAEVKIGTWKEIIKIEDLPSKIKERILK